MIQKVLSYLKRMSREIPSIKDRRSPILLMYLDFIYCFIVYGTVLDQYTKGGFYKLNRSERRKSVTYRKICKIYSRSITEEYVHVLQNKPEFNKFFAKLIKRKWLYSNEMDIEQFSKLCGKVSEIIIKPINESEGRGIRRIDIPKDKASISKLFGMLKKEQLIIEECLQSHSETSFGVRSLNTIRVHSIIDAAGNVHLVKSLLRVGVGDAIVDNYCAGGCIYEVDNLTGTICSASYSKKYEVSEYHPGTQIRMIGRKIPYWEELKKLVAAAHKDLPQIKFIGWDVAITENGLELIEGNHHPDYDLLEFVGQRFWWSEFKKYLNL